MSTPFPFRLVLASGSLGRRELLKLAGWPFDVRPADIDEPVHAPDGDVRRYVQETAWRKAAAVAPREGGDAVVIAADTVGWLDGALVLKPDDRDHARRILRTLAGRAHELWTGVTLWHRPSDRQVCWQERSLVAVKDFADDELEAYLDTNRWVGASGAYSIQLPRDPYLTVTEGSVSNVIGLPMESLARALDWLARA
jgi:septum formation protein